MDEVPEKDALWRTSKAPRVGVQTTCGREGVPNRGRTLDARPRAHVDLDSAEVLGGSGHWVHQGEERHSRGANLLGATAQLRRSTPEGSRVLRVHGGTRRGGHSKVHPASGIGGQAAGP